MITGEDIHNASKCSHRVYLDHNGDPAKKGDTNPFIELLWSKSLQTEKECLSILGDLPVVDLQGLKAEYAWPETLQAMKEGAPLIFKGCLIAEGWVGRPSILLKETGASSSFGSHYYVPIYVASETEWDSLSPKRSARVMFEHVPRLLFYQELIRRVQGYAEPDVRILRVADRKVHRISLGGDWNETLQETVERVRRHAEGQDPSEPVIGSHCHLCQWYAGCKKWADETKDPTLIFEVGKVKFDLKRAGLKTVEDIARMDPADYLGARKIPRLGETKLARMKRRAEVLLQGAPEIRPGYSFPKAKTEVFFDIEDDPTRDLVYLYGMAIRKGDEDPRYVYYLADGPKDERKAVSRFWKFLEEIEDAVIYVYSAKERGTLRRLMRKYRRDEEVFEKYVKMEYDLYSDLVLKHSDWPTYSYGIKSIAGKIGFKWRDSDPGGANSVAWFNRYLDAGEPERKRILKRILEYNEDDCLAMVAVRDYFAMTGQP